MINTEKKQFVEMGRLLQQDAHGKYRTTLRNRIVELRQEMEQRLGKEVDREEKSRLEAMTRAFIIADRILDKVFVSEPHEMNSESRAI